MTYIYGILGLGLIVFLHETGHFLAALIVGVKVESFSIGMGPVIFHKTIKGTDYRLSLIPLGGYCGMKGDKAFQEAIENNYSEIKSEKDSFYGVHQLKRAFIAFSGPFFNILFAIFAYTIIALIGYTTYTTSNQIILASEIYPEIQSTAADAGLKTGDRIIAINEKPMSFFSDISEMIATHPDELLSIKVIRDEKDELVYKVKSIMDKETGAGKIGIVNWVDLIIEEVKEKSPANVGGLLSGDLILKINNTIVRNSFDLKKLLEGKNKVLVEFSRNGKILNTTLYPENSFIGISFKILQKKSPSYSFLSALGKGCYDTYNTIITTLKSISLLFKGIDLTKAVSGPLRITKMLGDYAIAGFSESFSIGLITVLNFIALISVSLFIMNLLPIPVLDGGLILFALLELLFRRKINPKILYYIQFIGIGLIGILFCFALVGDIKYLFITK